MVKCYICGSSPNNPNKALDTLKLIQCLDCGTIACIKHRKGIIGGQCAKCGSARETVIAIRTGEYGGPSGESSGAAMPTGTSSASSGGGNTSISKSTLKDMQQTRSQATQDAQQRKDAEAEKQEKAKRQKEAKEEVLKSSLIGQGLLCTAAGLIPKRP